MPELRIAAFAAWSWFGDAGLVKDRFQSLGDGLVKEQWECDTLYRPIERDGSRWRVVKGT